MFCFHWKERFTYLCCLCRFSFPAFRSFYDIVWIAIIQTRISLCVSLQFGTVLFVQSSWLIETEFINKKLARMRFCNQKRKKWASATDPFNVIQKSFVIWIFPFLSTKSTISSCVAVAVIGVYLFIDRCLFPVSV